MRKILPFICIICSLFFPLYTVEGYIGENPGFDFYSRIDRESGEIANEIVKKRLSEFQTFSGFGKKCRGKIAWLDSERLTSAVIQEIARMNIEPIITIAQRKNVSLKTDEVFALVNCFRETYEDIQISALRQLENLEITGNMGLYSDGNASNSDYDIIVDIEKIHDLIFHEEIRYGGSLNNGKSGLDNLIRGKPIPPLITKETRKELDTLFGNRGTTTDVVGEITEGVNTQNTLSLEELGLKDICTTNTSASNIDSMINDSFLDELELAMTFGTNTEASNSTSFGKGYENTNTSGDGVGNTGSLTSNGDFFHTPRCDGIFCIKVKMVGGSESGLKGGSNDSIEGILDKHIKLLEPISWTDLGLQKMTNNQFQLPFTGLSLKLKSKVKGGGMFIGQKPTPKNQYKKDETKASKDAKFEQIYQCAFYSAGFTNSQPNIVNSVIGAGYIDRQGENMMNKQNTALPLGPSNPEDALIYQNCLGIALGRAEKTYYDSIGNDLSELMTFTDALGQEISEILSTGEKIDTLKVMN